ncbi:UDP-N-acetylglucosamine 2-epimerase (non-hydrolyzing) [Lutibacter sp.]|uniref:non-hydrolyzing UDP-N-acetylglucosamine 2-epimerase n=1 Tax=Lutibacter sp. TaxID=1925666 RepID=UPI0025BE185E|nr:UDP-N-acetylglucosamine 2-epimerase (non-hydrolyzing) [Lutibacter sp.]MCF6181006.1 UDP-N-acetylglucosamine 2-epimerase (non-hydrolyzing) [Lutibacter sp.]
MKKIVTIVGARPQFIKAAVLSRIIAQNNEIEEVLVHTGQHFDANMSAVFFDEMQIPEPIYNLGINTMNHGAMTGLMLQKIEEILDKEKPELVVVYGDTNSTLAGALAAKKMNIKIAHVEAGLRSFNMEMPEEINRILTDRISDLLCCPTKNAIKNLKQEGFDYFNCKVIQTGDIMKDAVKFYSVIASEKSSIITDLNLEQNKFVLATIHRQENTNSLEKLKTIFKGLEGINKKMKVIMPIHPRTKAILEKNNLKFNITFIQPVGYFDMLQLLKYCNLVVTDSGGLQKEAFYNKKACIIARQETEWIELVENNFAVICGANSGKIENAFERFQNVDLNFDKPLFGNNVGDKIYNEILSIL